MTAPLLYYEGHMDDLIQLQETIGLHRFFVELDDRLRSLVDADAIALTAATCIGSHLKANRCTYADVDDLRGTFHLTGNYVDGVGGIVGRYDSAAFGEDFLRSMRAGEAFVVADVATDPRLAGVRDAYQRAQIGAVIIVPLLKDGRFVAGMALHQAVPRAWTGFDIRLLEGVASRCWESIERSRITRELAASEARFRTITNAMPQFVWTADPDGNVDYWNEQVYEFLGVAPGSSLDLAWAEVIHPDDVAHAALAWTGAVASAGLYETTYRMLHHSGEYRWTLARGLPVRDDAGRVLKWMGTNTDIHAQKSSEQALQDANRRKDEFLAMLSHELRNPLAPIAAAAELLTVAKGDERVLRAGDIIRRQVKHLTGLVDDLLDAARVTQGMVKLHTERLDLAAVVADAAEQARPLIEARRHSLQLRLAAEPLQVAGDHKRLVQVLVNLLGNAAKYTPEGGRIEVGLEASGSEAVLTVRDNGAGMAPELVSAAFELFHQGARTLERAQGGLGIGLALVKSLAEQHGGSVRADSAGLGQGSCFTVRLPRAGGEAAPAAMPAPRTQPAAIAARRILVVDDNADAAQMIAMLLQMLGHETAVEYDPLQALAAVRERRFDTFILDIGLPGMDGHELARQIRELPGAADALFIALTGYGQEHNRKMSGEAGFHRHFVKPVDIEVLAQALTSNA
jgi:PAS domain S-box-containing protein